MNWGQHHSMHVLNPLNQLGYSPSCGSTTTTLLFAITAMWTHLFATGPGSCCGTQSSSGPRRSGSTEWTACHPPWDTLTPGPACRSRMHAACESHADLQHSNSQLSAGQFHFSAHKYSGPQKAQDCLAKTRQRQAWCIKCLWSCAV